jgi:cell division protein FtsB
VGTADAEADYVVPYFLMWLMRRVMRGDKGAERERLERDIQEWQERIKKLQAEQDGLRAENTRLKSDAQAVATVNTGALSRIQSKRERRIKVSR